MSDFSEIVKKVKSACNESFYTGYKGKEDKILEVATQIYIAEMESEKDRKIEFLETWKADVVESLGKYDANSVEEAYEHGFLRGIKEYHDAVENNLLNATFDILINDQIAEVLKEQK